MEDFYNNILVGKRIKNAREKAGLTQNKLHDLSGISITQISSYENGKRNIGLFSLKKIADATGVSIDELYSGNMEEKPIVSAVNEGKLIINCMVALFDKGVITILPREEDIYGSPVGIQNYYQIGFSEYIDILDDFIRKMVDFEENKENYPNPIEFRNQIIEASSKKINDRISKNQNNK